MALTKPGPGFLLVVGTGIMWGTIGVAAKLLYRQTDLNAVSVTWLRAAIASPVCLGLAWHALGRRLFAASRRDLTIMALLGIILIVYQYCYLAAIDRLGVSAATLISLCVAPVLVALLSALLLAERLTPRVVAALAAALVGTALLVGRGGGAGSGARIVGVALALGSAAGLASHVMVSRSLAGRHHPLRPLAISFTTGAIAFAPVALVQGVAWHINAPGWSLLLYLGIGPSCIAYLMYQRGLREITATTASIVTLLEPFIAAILAWILFGERFGLLGWLGGCLLIGAIAVLSAAPPPAPARAHHLEADPRPTG